MKRQKCLLIAAIIMIISLLSSCNQTETITCGACGADIPDDAIFCAKCGSSVTMEEVTQGTENTAPSHVHTWSEWTTTIEATCTAEGNQERSCSCGEKEILRIATVDHTETVDEAVAATCEKEGKTEGKHCSVCSIIIVSQKSTAKIKHIESSWIIDKAATKSEDGARHTECTMCKKVMSEEVLYATGGSAGLAYEINSDGKTCTIIGIGTCTDSNVVIPAVVDGYKVIKIATGAFLKCTTIREIKIPKTITSFDGYAFAYCTSLTSIIIPDSVTSLGNMAFMGCTSLKSITIPDSVTGIYIYTFLGCTSLKSVTIGKGVTAIGEQAFSDCTNLISITIPDSVTSIGKWAFSGCTNLTSITIPDSVTSVGEWVFKDCTSLKSITIPGSVTNLYGAFKNCTSLTSVTIGKGVTSIGEQTLRGCENLKSITIPSSVTSIDEEAFYGCKSLKSITIPDSVTRIDKNAFSRCTSLTSVTIGKGVTSIGESAFSGCESLTKATIPDSVTYIDFYAFSGCTSLKDVYYTGTAAEWKAISIKKYNDPLTNATIHYNSKN